MKFLLWPQHMQIYKKLCDTVNIKEMTLFKKKCPTNVTKVKLEESTMLPCMLLALLEAHFVRTNGKGPKLLEAIPY
ncbi:hypothetical protein EI555_008950 [Monodon monoceros]|uniref:Uncharacterized protein n=1 Tax=Monodon monoceros TaxID=40151 RepID=A0A4U1FNY2_MONMO|nr:hypothetical protein EI555_008950 [Monodon monoceros]